MVQVLVFRRFKAQKHPLQFDIDKSPHFHQYICWTKAVLCHNIIHNMTMHVSQPEIPALEVVGEFLMVYAKQM